MTLCAVKGCESPAACQVEYRASATWDGETGTALIVKGPYCNAHIIIVALTLNRRIDIEVKRRVMERAETGGAVVDYSTFSWKIVPYSPTLPDNVEYIPRPGMCSKSMCPNKATRYVAYEIPLEGSNMYVYITGPAYCDDHISEALSTTQIDPGLLRLALMRIIIRGFKPLIEEGVKCHIPITIDDQQLTYENLTDQYKYSMKMSNKSESN